jgi:hypothetical protein
VLAPVRKGSSRDRVAFLLMAFALVVGSASPAAGQESISDVLSFLLTNRSIPTEDFVQDELAAAATRDTISDFLLTELSALPTSSSATGFTYRLNPALGSVERSSDSFGPFFVERSLTAGKEQASLGLFYQSSAYANIDGRNLRDGTLVATASRLRGASQPFDVETVTLRVRTDTVTLSANYGVSDRLDLGAAIPFVRLSLNGQRVDTYRGQTFLQATASGSAEGVGDIIIRAKYGVLRRGGSGVAVGGEMRLPTGNEENLLGAGATAVKPRLIGSFESGRVGVHGDVGYTFGGLSDELDYGGALAVVAFQRLTLVGEIVGRRLQSIGQLTEITSTHPRLVGVETIRLTSVAEPTERVVAVAGFKWNLASTWLLSGNVLRPMTTAGLNAHWVPTLTFDYSFGR